MSFRRLLIIGIIIILFTTCTQVNITLPNSYLELNLNDSFTSNPFARQTSALEVFRVIEKATQDDNIIGIVLNIGTINRSREYLWELRSALEQFKAGTADGTGKKIVAYINNADIDVYTLASVADKIVMDEMGILTMLGYSAGKGYFSQTLEKLGIGVQELRYFEYKSAAESYTRTNMSEADRRQYSDYLDDIFNLTRSTLMEARGWTLEEFNDIINNKFIHSASSALEHNLVDYGRSSFLLSAIAELKDEYSNSYYLYGDSDTALIGKIPYLVPKGKSASIIGVVYANGETDMTRGMEIAKLAKIIRDLGDSNRIKAIVVRVNSPGGDAQAAEHLAQAIEYAKQSKPVVISMGQLAASGGYWISTPASHIMANPYTITGSIGVIGSWFYDNGLYNKLGVSADILKRGDHSDMVSGILIPHRKLSAQEEEQYKKFILDLYEIFINKVAFNRKMETEKVEAVAQGRIFSGIRANEEGLIDSVGSLIDAINEARELAGIDENASVSYREFPEPKFMDMLLGRLSAKSEISLFDFMIPEDIRYRIENNGKVMPIMPLDNF